MSGAPQLSVVLAVEDSTANLPAILQRLAIADEGRCELLLCCADAALWDELPPESAAVRLLRGALGAHVPQLWRDGIVAARAPWVALLSAHVVPADGWLDALLKCPIDDTLAGVGGWFSQDPAASASDWAIYLLRYAAFARPLDANVSHIAADNAAYRRDAVLAHPDLVARGFWEVEYHVRFVAQGLRLQLLAALEVQHVNRYSPRRFARQRRDHGFAFGNDRARRVGPVRACLLALLAPVVPVVLLAKVLVRAQRHRLLARAPLGTWPWLAWFVCHWALGEARGTLRAITGRD
jgi:hypothetical protein